MKGTLSMKQRNNLKYTQSVKQRFSFRKTFIGLAAVALGSTLYITNAQNVKADEVNANTNTNTQVQENQAANQGETNQSVQTSQSGQTTTVSASSHSEIQSNIETKATNQNGQETATVNPNQAKNMMAGQGTVNVHIDLTNLNQDNKKINLNFSNVGQDKDFSFNANNLAEGQETTLDDNWKLQNNGNGQLVASWTNQNEFPTELHLIVPLEGNVRKITSPVNDTSVNLTITSHDEEIAQQKVLTANLTPYVDQVENTEIIKGFPMGTTTVASEKQYGNISDSDYQNMDMSPDQTVLQWGVYFNYGAASLGQALQDAIFDLTFAGQQKLIISSIKVYQVPDNMITNARGHRFGEGDAYPGGGYYYDQITQGSNYSYNFSYYLQHHVNGNGISVSQPNGEFTVANVPNAARHAYFFQIDTLLNKGQKVASTGETLTSESFKGAGKVKVDQQISSWTSQISGGGSGKVYPAQPTQTSQNSQPTQTTTPTTPVKPVTPVQPTAPKTTPDDNKVQPIEPQESNPDQNNGEAQPVLPQSNDEAKNDTTNQQNDSSTVDHYSPVRPLANHVGKKRVKIRRTNQAKKQLTKKSFNVKQVVKKSASEKALPTTGEKESHATLLGSLALILTSLLLLADRKKHNN